MEIPEQNTKTKKNRIFRLVLGHLQDILIVILISNVISFLFEPNYENFWKRIYWASLYGVFIGTVLWKGNQYIGFYLSKRIDPHKYPYKILRWNLASMFVYSIIAILVVNYIWYVIIFDWSLQKMFTSGFITMVIELVITVIITSIFFAIGFFQAWRESAVNEERLKKESIALQYKALRNQVNPHFLFNNLNTLTTLVHKDQDQAVRFIKELSDVYRYVLEQKDNETVDIDTELKFLEKYMFLQKIRHNESIEYQVDMKGTNKQFIVPMALQMLVENAVKHNIASEESPLKINLSSDLEYITVTNNLQKKKIVSEGGGIGLENLRNTYSHLTDKKMIIEEDEKEFVVKVPVLKSDEL